MLSAGLVAKGVIATKAQPESEGPTVSPVPRQDPSVDPLAMIQAGVETEDLKLALQLRELELQTKTRKVELIHLRIRAMELDRPPPPPT